MLARVVIIGPIEIVYNTTYSKQYQTGFTKGCQDGQSGKSPDPTQFDKVGGFSNHTVDYNTGYVDGYNKCSPSQQIEPLID